MTFFEGLLVIIFVILFIALIIYVGFTAMGTNERFHKSPMVLQIFIALIVGEIIIYFILKAAKSCHQEPTLDFIISVLGSI